MMIENIVKKSRSRCQPIALSTCFAVLFAGMQPSLAADGIDHLNLFIGTGYNGHTFPSATVPFGSVAPGPDCSVQQWHAACGFDFV